MKRKTTILFIISLTLTATFISSALIVKGYASPRDENELSTNLLTFGDYATDWSLKEIRSDLTKSLSSYRGKVVLLEFFYTECGACTDSFLPYLLVLRTHYASSQLAMLSITIDLVNDDEVTLEDYIALHGISWDVFRDTSTVTTDYEVQYAPTFYIIDQNQIVHYSHTGVVSDTFLIGKIDEIVDSDNNGSISEFWQNNWYWFVIGSIAIIILSVLFIQRRRVVLHNRKIDQQTIEAKKRRRRKRTR